jgi:hypothetical protein
MTVVGLAWACLAAAASASTPSAPSYPGLGPALDGAEAAFGQFEETTGRIDFHLWKAPESLVAAASGSLERTLKQIQSGRVALGILRKSERPSPVDLFLVLEALHATAVAGNLGQDVSRLGGNEKLAAELLSAAENANH